MNEIIIILTDSIIMSGNSFGKLYKIYTFGESHGDIIGVIIDGAPPKIRLNLNHIQSELNRRKALDNPFTSKRKEQDIISIKSGIIENNLTTGTPLCITLENKKHKTQDYENIKNIYRPGHSDYSYYKKYGIRDYRGGGRASGRETASRVIAGAIAKQILNTYKIKIKSYIIRIGKYYAQNIDLDFAGNNYLSFPDNNLYNKVLDYLREIKESGDSIGGVAEIIVSNVPAGLGQPVFDKLDADIAKSLMSIGAVKGVEIGQGFDSAFKKGSENNDEMREKGFLSNNAGGILGGISTGQDIISRIAIKPTPSISIEQQTVNENGEEVKINIQGRHDTFIAPRILPVAESMIAMVILDHLLIQNSYKDFI
ncbi:MAG: chorismate synthase [Spirochaetota bacterium]